MPVICRLGLIDGDQVALDGAYWWVDGGRTISVLFCMHLLDGQTPWRLRISVREG